MNQDTNQDFESAWNTFEVQKPDTSLKEFAEYFFRAGIQSTQKKPQQVPALFKPKDSIIKEQQ